jgi:hypothetical protein
VICPKCGENNSDKFRFCGMCGAVLEARRAPKQLDPLSAFPSSDEAAAASPVPPIARPLTRPLPMATNEPAQRAPERMSSAERVPERVPIKQNFEAPPEPRRQLVLEKSPKPVSQPLAASVAERPVPALQRLVPPISGPSMLGLNQVSTLPAEDVSRSVKPQRNETRFDDFEVSNRTPNRNSSFHSGFDGPDLDLRNSDRPNLEPTPFDDVSSNSIRQKSFSGFDSYSESSRGGAGRALLLLILLAALGAAGWWAYNNYIGLVKSRKAQTDNSVIGNPSGTAVNKSAVESSAAPPSSAAAPSSPAEASPASVPPPSGSTSAQPQTASTSNPPAANSSTPASDVGEGPSENAGAASVTAASVPNNTAPAPKAAPVAKSAAPRSVPPKNALPKREPTVATVRASKIPTAQPLDNGDASFRKAEGYLYGRGPAQNCDEAVKNLKAASAKSNAKARSTFGTMYATGHCVPRDLPTSYLWFALALRADPNNQILEKDLNAVWNQMTPPERQLATRMKQ